MVLYIKLPSDVLYPMRLCVKFGQQFITSCKTGLQLSSLGKGANKGQCHYGIVSYYILYCVVAGILYILS